MDVDRSRGAGDGCVVGRRRPRVRVGLWKKSTVNTLIFGAADAAHNSPVAYPDR
jgi:hypothetical protein